jgi:hypothetical protein
VSDVRILPLIPQPKMCPLYQSLTINENEVFTKE